MRASIVWALSGVLLAGLIVVAAQISVPAAAARSPAAPDDLRAMTEMARVCTDGMRQMMAMGMGMMGSGMMGRGGMMGGMMPMVWWWALQALLFWGLVLGSVVVVILLLRRTKSGASEAMAALQLRLAKGEMSADEYEQVRRLLQ